MMASSTVATRQHWSEREMRDYGFRAASDVTPGVDYLWRPWLDPEHLRTAEVPAHRHFVKVLASERTPEGMVTFTLELPSGRTFTRAVRSYRHFMVFYPAAVSA